MRSMLRAQTAYIAMGSTTVTRLFKSLVHYAASCTRVGLFYCCSLDLLVNGIALAAHTQRHFVVVSLQNAVGKVPGGNYRKCIAS
jgi:hypothetical protein